MMPRRSNPKSFYFADRLAARGYDLILIARDKARLGAVKARLSMMGRRVEAVVAGATATEFWNKAGLPHATLPKGMVMGAEEMVDAVLAGLDNGEVVTMRALKNAAQWDRYEAFRRDLSKIISLSFAVDRYESKQYPSVAQ